MNQQTSQSKANRKLSVLVSGGLSQFFLLASLIFLILTIDIFASSGAWAFIPYLVFLPAEIFFIITGWITVERDPSLKSIFLYENIFLLSAAVLGILYLALTLRDTSSLTRPGSLDLESAVMLFIALVIPCAIGLLAAWYPSRASMPVPAQISSTPGISSPALFVLWILINLLATLLWSLVIVLLDPLPTENLSFASGLGASLAAGTFAGIFQALLLTRVIKPASRKPFTLWALLSALGWILFSLVNFAVPVSRTPQVILALAVSLGIGFSQWLILKRYARAASLWIFAPPLDYLLSLSLSSAYAYGDLIGGFVTGTAGALVSSAALVYILRPSPDLNPVETVPGEVDPSNPAPDIKEG